MIPVQPAITTENPAAVNVGNIPTEQVQRQFAMRTRAWLRFVLVVALSTCRSSALLVRLSRRGAVAGGAAALATACQPRPAAARRSSGSSEPTGSSYDSVPVNTGPDLDALAALEARARLRKEREALAAKKNAQVQQLTRVVSQATDAAEYNDAMAALTVTLTPTLTLTLTALVLTAPTLTHTLTRCGSSAAARPSRSRPWG